MDEELVPQEESRISGINVTPLVDVCLVLVLIFMVTTPFFTKPLLDVILPRAVASEAEARQNITLSIAVDGRLAVNEIPIDAKALRGELEKQRKQSGITFLLIRADERVLNGTVQDAMKVGQRAGMKRIAFLTEPK